MKNNRGTSLIELVIAIALIGIIIAPFLLFFNQSMTMNEGTDELFEASQIAANCIEIVKKEAKESAVNEAGMETIKATLSEIMGVEESKITIISNISDCFSITFIQDDYKVEITINKSTVDGDNDIKNFHSVIVLVLDKENKTRGNIENWVRFDGEVSGG